MVGPTPLPDIAVVRVRSLFYPAPEHIFLPLDRLQVHSDDIMTRR